MQYFVVQKNEREMKESGNRGMWEEWEGGQAGMCNIILQYIGASNNLLQYFYDCNKLLQYIAIFCPSETILSFCNLSNILQYLNLKKSNLILF